MYEVPEVAAENPKRKRKVIVWVIAFTVTLFVGVGIGSATGDSAATANPEPKTVTETVEAKPKLHTVYEEVEVVPDVCLVALNEGDRLYDAAEFLLGWSSEYLGAVSEFDTDTMLALNEEMNASTNSGEFEGVFPLYEEAAAQCRAAGE